MLQYGRVAIDPPLILVCVAHKAQSYQALADGSRFAVNFLALDQETAGAAGGCGAGEFMAVEAVAPERDKQRARGQAAAIRRDAIEDAILADETPFSTAGETGKRERGQRLGIHP